MTTGEVRPRTEDPEAVKTEWLGRLDSLVEEVEGWAKMSGWHTRRIAKTVSERRLGTYKVPVLLMEKETVEAVLNPVARYVPGADGAVDLYVAPAYDDIASLYFEGNHWVIHYGDRPDPSGTQRVVEITDRPYSEQTMRPILDGMSVNGCEASVYRPREGGGAGGVSGGRCCRSLRTRCTDWRCPATEEHVAARRCRGRRRSRGHIPHPDVGGVRDGAALVSSAHHG